MTKAELIAAVAKDCDLPKTAAEIALNSVTANITKAMKRKDKLTLTGFGTFSVSKRKPRKGRNPQTGQEIAIKGGYSPRFKAGKDLKEAVS